MRAFRPFPILRPDKDFALFFAFLAVKFVDWHVYNILIYEKK